MTYDDRIHPVPELRPELERTVSAWGPEVQADLARLDDQSIVGAGSVGAIVAEALALNRGPSSSSSTSTRSRWSTSTACSIPAVCDACASLSSKVENPAPRALVSRARRQPIQTSKASCTSIVEEDGFRAALDCDAPLLAALTARGPGPPSTLPRTRHGIPVIDGGIQSRESKRCSASPRQTGARTSRLPAGAASECLEQ